MAGADISKCHRQGCTARVEFIYAPARGKALAFDERGTDRRSDPLACWVTYEDPRTRATFARKLQPGEPVDFDSGEELLRRHATWCPGIPRTNHDR